MEALTYPNVKKIIYTSARGDATKAIADLRGLVVQKVNIIVVFADASTALLPSIKEATAAQAASQNDEQKKAIQGLLDRLGRKEDVNK